MLLLLAAMPQSFPVTDLRRQFPSLERAGQFVFFDNAAGAQVPSRVIEAVTDHLLERNVQRRGPDRHARGADALRVRTRAAVAGPVNGRSADQIARSMKATWVLRARCRPGGQPLGERPETAS